MLTSRHPFTVSPISYIMFASCLFFLLLCVSSIQRILPLCLLYPPYPVAVSPLFPGSCHCVSFISLSRPRVSSIPLIRPCVPSTPLILSLCLLYPPYPVTVSPLSPVSCRPVSPLSPLYLSLNLLYHLYTVPVSPLSPCLLYPPYPILCVL